MKARHQLSDLRFGKLYVIKESVKRDKNRAVMWECRCDCGVVVDIRSTSLISGKSNSCGCSSTKHSQRSNRTPTYHTWNSVVQRCRNPNHPAYKYYGGRGVSVCEQWLDFLNFYRDMGERPSGTTLDRVDVNGNYEPDNCRWATAKEQARNKRDTIRLTIAGETRALLDWSEILGLEPSMIIEQFECGKLSPLKEVSGL